MKLLGFRYLRRHQVLILAMIVTLTSILFSITAFSVLGFYSGFGGYIGERENIVAIYDMGSRTPFTGLVPSYLTDRINLIAGVLASSPEVLAPCIVKDEPVFIRGVIPGEFSKLNSLTVLCGRLLELNDFDSAMVGRSLADKLGLMPGDKVLVLGVLADRYFEFRVKGIFKSDSPVDDEAIVPLYVGQWLRAADYGQVTFIRVKVDRSLVSPAEIIEEIAKEASEHSRDVGQAEGKPEGMALWPRRSFGMEDIGVEEAQSLMRRYLEEHGVTEETLVVLSVTLFAFSSASIVVAAIMLVRQHEHEIDVLRSLGASRRTIKIDLLVKALSVSLFASSSGIVLSALVLRFFGEIGYLQVSSHRVTFQLNPLIITVNLALFSILVATSVLRSVAER